VLGFGDGVREQWLLRKLLECSSEPEPAQLSEAAYATHEEFNMLEPEELLKWGGASTQSFDFSQATTIMDSRPARNEGSRAYAGPGISRIQNG